MSSLTLMFISSGLSAINPVSQLSSLERRVVQHVKQECTVGLHPVIFISLRARFALLIASWKLRAQDVTFTRRLS